MQPLFRDLLRAVRATLATTVAAAVDRTPALEPWFVRTGRSLARSSRLGGGLYRVAQESLIQRLQERGNRYREVEIRNVPLVVDVTDATGRYPFFYSQPYEGGDRRHRDGAEAGSVFLDVGAHIGYPPAARIVGESGRVVAFEPHAERARCSRMPSGMASEEHRDRADGAGGARGGLHAYTTGELTPSRRSSPTCHRCEMSRRSSRRR